MSNTPRFTITVFSGHAQVAVFHNSAPDAMAAARQATYDLFNKYTRVSVHDRESQQTIEFPRSEIER